MNAACPPAGLTILIWILCVGTGGLGGSVVTLLIQRIRRERGIDPDNERQFPENPEDRP